LHIVPVPGRLEFAAFDQLVSEMEKSGDDKVLFDARHLRWVDPGGIIGLLSAGTVARKRLGAPPRLQILEGAEVTSYLARMRFFEAAEGIFDLEVRPPRRSWASSDVLLEITPITTNSDIHAVVDRVQNQAGSILSKTLNYQASAVVQFSVILSEVCQNIIEHAEAPGWVAAQRYAWTKRLGRQVLILSVSDVGKGFKGSLADTHATRFGDRWGDATALEAAFIHGLTRFPDSGRGQGIQQIRKQVRRWEGSISIRSGTARIADVPDWDDTPPLEENLPAFPGAQIQMVLPERIPDHA
jgi:anti-sigma regulatory factor (Ser/Thr protein kinase)